MSNFIGKDHISYAKRYYGKEKKMVQIPCPFSVEIYGRFIGGVDKADMLLSLYRTKLRSRKWYHRTVFYLVSLALINSFTVSRQISGKGSLLEFQIEICRCLLKAEKEVDSDEDMENHQDSRDLSKPSKSLIKFAMIRVNHGPIKCGKPK